MTASIPHRYIRMTTFPALASLFVGLLTILEGNAGLIDLRAEWLRTHDLPIIRPEAPPYAPELDISDSDHDGLTDGSEARYGCNPDRADTDRDGLTDGQEVRIFDTDPSSSAPDRDGDGITDYAEAVFSPARPPGMATA